MVNVKHSQWCNQQCQQAENISIYFNDCIFAKKTAMIDPTIFDDIRPYNDSEVPSAISGILASGKTQYLLMPFMPPEEVKAIMDALPHVKTVDQFQLGIIKALVKGILQRSNSELLVKNTMNLNAHTPTLFISNHRDIVLDPTFLDYALHLHGVSTVEIAIGNNLLIEPWIEDLVRVNKSFIVKRDVQGRELLLASQKMSSYIRYAVSTKKSNVWIAQREGRAKDGNDQTQTALLKMLNMGCKHMNPAQSFLQLHITPVSISYEYDPCDVLKAKELYYQEKNLEFKKTMADDLLSMKTGMTELKGRICYSFAKPIAENVIPQDADIQTATEILAQYIDNCIYEGYELFPSHYYSFDKFNNTNTFEAKYNADDIERFENILSKKVNKMLPEFKDNPDFLKQVYRQYANIVKNALKL